MFLVNHDIAPDFKYLRGGQTVTDETLVHWKKIKKSLRYWHARSWQLMYFLKNWLFNIKSNYVERQVLLFLAVLIAISAVFVPSLQNYFEPYLSARVRLDSIRALFLTLGGALIGATAIAFSLIMFAMQVNIERMPYGLFRKFSSDAKLLSVFAATFLLAALITGLSLIQDKSWMVGAAVTTIWCSLIIILLFLLAYRRALDLISPTKQLELVVADTKKNFKIWDKAVKRTIPIFQKHKIFEKEEEESGNKHDIYRVTYFQLYPYWTASAEQALSYCITFSRRYAEQGDHEVSRVALNGIIAINAAYIKTKGKTFFSNNLIIDNPLASDRFLSLTLEHLRQNVQLAISRKDEQFIENNLQSLLQLMQLYLSINNGNDHAVPSHANLVSSYLTSAVESIIPHDMADVLIEGVTLLGRAALLIVQHDKPEYTVTISNKIALIACTGAVNKNYQPVTQVAVKQLASLTFELLRSKTWDVLFAIKRVRDDVKLIAKTHLMMPDTPLISIHSTSLASFYSRISNDTLLSQLTKLVDALSEAESSDKAAQRVIRHMVDWAEGLYQGEKELLLVAIEKKSNFTLDLILWVGDVTKLLLAVSCTNACDVHNAKKLQKSALWLIYVFSFIPDKEETIKYIETYQIADNIFKSSVDAHNRGCDNEALEIRKLLLSWTFKAGKYQTGWATLEKACCGLACLNLIFELTDENLINDIDIYLSKEDAPNFDIRSRTASALHEEAEKYRTGNGYDAIDIAMSRVDQARLRVLLHRIADYLYPEGNNTGNIESIDVTDCD